MTEPSQAGNTVECPPAKDSAVRALIVAAMLLGFGLWCAIDQRPYAPASEDINAFSSWAFNFFGQFLFMALGLASLVWAVLYLRRRLVADDQGIGFVGKEKLAWSDIRHVDASKLESAQLLYLTADGKTLRLAGWQLRNFRELVSFIEKHVPPGSISRKA